ncbi:MAG: Nif3-like dinuclear metal center hexameric protein [Polyangiaceae bacterium]|nr:Nif3-like dinuclear metal center hexameric protein [Polyangiaceae bacterium]
MPTALVLAAAVERLEAAIPLGLAESWDNVGLLVEPLEPRPVSTVVLTIDLTEAVLEEAASAGAELIVAYHPLIFAKLTRVTRRTAIERVVQAALAHRIAVWSPHTALDALPGGVNDWLADGLGEGEREPLAPLAGRPEAGQGRRLTLAAPAPVGELADRLAAHLGVAELRVAAAARHTAGEPVSRIALCAGAGGGVLERVGGVDLVVSGELRHHDVLARVADGTSVFVCDHTGSERGYLPRLAARVAAELPGARVLVAARDAAPLRTRVAVVGAGG